MDWIKQRYHFILAGVWVILVAPSMIWWAESILWVIFLSLYANFESSMAAGESRKDRECLHEIRDLLKEMHDDRKS